MPTDGPWPAAKLMKKLVTLGPDAWNSGKYTGDRLGMNGYFGLFCEMSCDTEFDYNLKDVGYGLDSRKTLKKMKVKNGIILSNFQFSYFPKIQAGDGAHTWAVLILSDAMAPAMKCHLEILAKAS